MNNRDEPHVRRGWLKNGNPSGDLSKVVRCGARAKRTQQACMAPAMKNGRCRFHGGKSTGPLTPDGLERSRKAHWKTGEYSAKNLATKRSVTRLLREWKELQDRMNV